MGHERVGLLPRTKPWRKVIDQIGKTLDAPDELASLADSTLENVRSRLFRIQEDSGVKAAFEFLVVLSIPESARSALSESDPPINFDDNPSPLRLAGELQRWVAQHRNSAEYAEIARRAATDAIAGWTTQQRRQPNLFGSEGQATEVWRKAQSPAGFCEVSRLFFAKFTERYLNYFLEREASSVFSSVKDRERFSTELRAHVDEVTRHAFETSKITQSFSAGWFNNYMRDAVPSDAEVERFLSTAFNKIREELSREAAA